MMGYKRGRRPLRGPEQQPDHHNKGRQGIHSAVVTAIDNLLNRTTRSMEEEIKW
jgi:hypothetical protein